MTKTRNHQQNYDTNRRRSRRDVAPMPSPTHRQQQHRQYIIALPNHLEDDNPYSMISVYVNPNEKRVPEHKEHQHENNVHDDEGIPQHGSATRTTTINAWIILAVSSATSFCSTASFSAFYTSDDIATMTIASLLLLLGYHTAVDSLSSVSEE